jgi:hypothetical protein
MTTRPLDTMTSSTGVTRWGSFLTVSGPWTHRECAGGVCLWREGETVAPEFRRVWTRLTALTRGGAPGRGGRG